jgi:hypothetical protein
VEAVASLERQLKAQQAVAEEIPKAVIDEQPAQTAAET